MWLCMYTEFSLYVGFMLFYSNCFFFLHFSPFIHSHFGFEKNHLHNCDTLNNVLCKIRCNNQLIRNVHIFKSHTYDFMVINLDAVRSTVVRLRCGWCLMLID